MELFLLCYFQAPIEDTHPYIIAEKWKKLQTAALDLQNLTPEKVYSVSYESLLENKDEVIAKLGKFIILNDFSHNLESKSSKSNNFGIADADSFTKTQLSKWKKNNELSKIDISHIEASCFNEMKILGYNPASNERPTISQIDIEKFEAENIIGNKEKQEKLKDEDKEDWKRRQNQEKILKEIFCNELEIVIDDKAEDEKSASKPRLQYK